MDSLCFFFFKKKENYDTISELKILYVVCSGGIVLKP